MKHPRLNLFALPSQTAIVFYLVVAVLWGGIGINMTGAQIIPLWPLGFLLLCLPFYGFLLRPAREQMKYNLQPPAEGEYPRLVRRVAEAARLVGLPRPPILWIDRQRPQPVYSLGTFRRGYIVFSQKQAQILDDWLAHPATAPMADVPIFHELYHFRNGDIWKLGLLVEIFRYGFLVMLWAMLFFLGWGFVLLLARDAFLQTSLAEILNYLPAEVQTALVPFLPTQSAWLALQDKMRAIDMRLVLQFILNVTLPYVLLTLFLWLFYRPLLWRVREYYADAGVFQMQKATTPFLKFILRHKRKPLQASGLEDRNFVLREWLASRWQRIRRFLKGDFWPDFGLRWQALQSPQTVFYDWKQITWILGGLALALEVFLATPLTLLFYGANPLVFPTLVVLAGLLYFLLPKIVFGDHVWRDALRVLGGIALVRAAWMSLTLITLWGMYVLAPNALLGILQSAIYSAARYAGTGYQFELDVLDFLITASWRNSIQIPVVLAIQLLGFAILLFVFRRVLTWYGFLTTSQRFQHVVLAAVIGVCLALGTLILPGSMAVLLGKNPNLALLLTGFLITVIFVGIFYVLDRKYHAHCPTCYASANPKIIFGAVCESCGNRLLPWLVSDEA